MACGCFSQCTFVSSSASLRMELLNQPSPLVLINLSSHYSYLHHLDFRHLDFSMVPLAEWRRLQMLDRAETFVLVLTCIENHIYSNICNHWLTYFRYVCHRSSTWTVGQVLRAGANKHSHLLSLCQCEKAPCVFHVLSFTDLVFCWPGNYGDGWGGLRWGVCMCARRKVC